jgi:hypothetical protein
VRTESHISSAKAKVREVDLARHAAVRLEGGRAYAVSAALALPRLWAYATGAVLDGFAVGLARQKTANGAQRIGDAIEEARQRLHQRCEALVEKRLPDATLLGLVIDHGELHVACAGPGRVYLHRRGDPKRLTPREDEPEGLLKARPALCREMLEPGDVILAGTVSAFSMRAIGKLASVLEADPKSPTAVLASLLTEPAGKAGLGAAAIALRVA